jgi:hypothetical protein
LVGEVGSRLTSAQLFLWAPHSCHALTGRT